MIKPGDPGKRRGPGGEPFGFRSRGGCWSGSGSPRVENWEKKSKMPDLTGEEITLSAEVEERMAWEETTGQRYLDDPPLQSRRGNDPQLHQVWDQGMDDGLHLRDPDHVAVAAALTALARERMVSGTARHETAGDEYQFLSELRADAVEWGRVVNEIGSPEDALDWVQMEFAPRYTREQAAMREGAYWRQSQQEQAALRANAVRLRPPTTGPSAPLAPPPFPTPPHPVQGGNPGDMLPTVPGTRLPPPALSQSNPRSALDSQMLGKLSGPRPGGRGGR